MTSSKTAATRPLVCSALIALFAASGLSRAADTTYVRYNTILGPMDVQLLSDEAPKTVANFLGYVNTGAYTDSIFHRAQTGFFIQGGSVYDNVNLSLIPVRAAIYNEFSVSNTRGTLATSLNGADINSATSGWFFNDADNSATFDPAKYTVFGMVANSTSLQVLDALSALPAYSLSAEFSQIPLFDYVSGNVNLSNLVEITSIVPESAPVDATISLSGLSVTANGVAHMPIVTTNPPNLTAYTLYNGIPTPPSLAGSYPIVSYITSPGYVGTATGTLVVSAANASPTKATITLIKVATTYDGNPHPVTATTSPAGLDVDILYNGSNVVPINAGSYTVVATIDDPSYTGTAKSTVVISKAAAGAFTVNSVAATFDDNPHLATANTTPPGLGVSFTYNRSSTPPLSAGTYAAVGKIDDPNYTSRSSATGTVTISPVNSATVTVPDSSFPYDGKPQPATATTNPPGMAVTFTYNISATVPTAKGTYTVVGTIKSPDYTGPTVTGSGTETITEGVATVTLGNLTQVYSGKPISVTATTVPAKLAVIITYNGSTTPPMATGSYPIVATVNDPNYAGSATGTLTITPVPPTAVTGVASAITTTGATLSGTVDPKGSATTVTFQYGPTTSYGGTAAASDAGTGNAGVVETTPITGLSANTLYHYRVVANNGVSTVNGADKTFTTAAVPTPATPLLSASGAQVGFGVNPNGVATTVVFKYGTDANNLDLMTASQSIGAGKSVVNVTAFLAGLMPGVPYFYEVVVQTGTASYSSSIESFTTLGFDTSLVVMKGDTANGTTGATYSNLGDASINDNDGVAFAASLTTDTGSPAITTTNDLGIWANQGSATLQLLAQTGTVAPDAGAATFISFGDPLYNTGTMSHANSIAFGGQLKIASGQATSTNSLGIWSTITGALHLVARQGDPVTGASSFSNFTALAISDVNVLVLATLAPSQVDGVTASNDFGVWEGTLESNLVQILRTGDTPGGKTISGLTLSSMESQVVGQTRDFASNTGDMTALATFTDKTTGIVTAFHNGNAITETLAYKINDPAPGPGNTTFSKFSSPIINNNDHLAFAAGLTDGGTVTSASNTGIWAQDGTGALQLITRTGNTVGNGTPFLTLSDPVYNNNEITAFAATYKVGRVLTTGIFSNEAGSIETVTQTGNQAPGCAAGVTFSVFTGLVLPDAGGVNGTGGALIFGTIKGTGVSAANNTGIWIVDGTGTLQLVVRTGDTVLPGKTISALVFLPFSSVLDGQTRSFAKNGDLAYLVTFTDKTQAIFNVQFP